MQSEEEAHQGEKNGPMRTLLLCIFTLMLCTRVPAQSQAQPQANDGPIIKVTSVIKSATVFREGAHLQRRGSARISKGRSTLVFTGLTGSLDPGSVQVKAEELLILSVSHRLYFYELPESGAAENTIYNRIEALDRERRRLLTEVNIAKEEEEVLRANRDLDGTSSGLNAEDLERGVKFQRERIRAIKLSYLMLDDSLRANRESRELLQKQISELGQTNQRPATGEVVVVVESEAPITSDFHLGYRVDDAGWTPE